MTASTEISLETILPSVFVVRGVKAMLDSDLAALYGVSTKRLNERVKRNIKRFPDDFLFQLPDSEFQILRSQSATSSWGGRRTLPYAFTEYGIAIMRAFVQMRQLLTETSDLKHSIESLRVEYDEKFEIVFETLDRILAMEVRESRPVGFIWPADRPEK